MGLLSGGFKDNSDDLYLRQYRAKVFLPAVLFDLWVFLIDQRRRLPDADTYKEMIRMLEDYCHRHPDLSTQNLFLRECGKGIRDQPVNRRDFIF